MKAPDYVLYHANCDDGFAAAYAIWSVVGEQQTDYLPVNYKQPPPDLREGADVLIVDFSYPPATLKAMAEKYQRVVVLDHHKTALEALQGLPRYPARDTLSLTVRWREEVEDGLYVHFDMRKSGCRLAWEFAHHGSERMPGWMECVEDRDLWRKALSETDAVTAAIRSYPRTFSTWDGFSLSRLVEEGKHISRYQRRMVWNICQSPGRAFIGRKEVPIVFCSYDFVSDAAHELLQRDRKAAFAVAATLTPTGMSFSLRSESWRDDVSAIAKLYGGGGHRNAASFSLPAADGLRLLVV